ncbi:ABC transporter ATP-binding protein [Comamonas thiooxydans]|uniref:ABC transporter ATP-binding protein n=1 Tax=Comamonas thiooxydans TaxID=363952 RepID=UPI002449D1CB|nr:ABC transporter ATP-binding protein [Comamonas thiooxydans]MDH1473177.1 ABC transporter ATP-binding protein [Comamonas thiooxydans]
MSSNIETGIALATEALSVQLGEREVLRQISLRIPRGRWTAIVGPNGAGKSTLLRAMAGMRATNQRQSGAVLLQGRELGDWNGRERAKALAWLGQNQPVAADMAVYDLVMLGRLPHQGWLAPASSADRQAVEQALRQTHAWDWRQRSIGQLSGGERQRVLLARALAVQAGTLLMDEPLANLDPPHQTDWMLTARSLVQQGATLVSVLHELSFALLADEMVVMQAGRITHQGACSDPATHAALESVFDRRIQVRELDGLWLALPRLS